MCFLNFRTSRTVVMMPLMVAHTRLLLLPQHPRLVYPNTGLRTGFSLPGPFPCGFPKIGISQKSGFRAFLGISGCFYGDFKCPWAPEIHIFCLKSRFLREILKKREIHILGKTTWEGLRSANSYNIQ